MGPLPPQLELDQQLGSSLARIPTVFGSMVSSNPPLVSSFDAMIEKTPLALNVPMSEPV
jgi:hypothetical protein